jgi:hypothetical protein
MRFRQAHTITTDATRFWEVYFDPEFNRELFMHELQFVSYRIVSDKVGRDGTRMRRVECVPSFTLPAAMQRYFGATLRFTEVGTFDPNANCYYTQAVLGFGGDKLTLTSAVSIQHEEPGRCKRLVTGNLTVRVGRVA